MTTDVMTTRTMEGAGEHHHDEPALVSWLKDTTAKLTTWWAWHQSYKQTLKELNELGNKDLDDIGVARHDIPAIARSSANEAHRH